MTSRAWAEHFVLSIFAAFAVGNAIGYIAGIHTPSGSRSNSPASSCWCRSRCCGRGAGSDRRLRPAWRDMRPAHGLAAILIVFAALAFGAWWLWRQR
jgi:hypothetical protein